MGASETSGGVPEGQQQHSEWLSLGSLLWLCECWVFVCGWCWWAPPHRVPSCHWLPLAEGICEWWLRLCETQAIPLLACGDLGTARAPGLNVGGLGASSTWCIEWPVSRGASTPWLARRGPQGAGQLHP